MENFKFPADIPYFSGLGYFSLFTVEWLSNFSSFRSKIQTHFGPYDAFSNVEAKLEQLVMKDNHKAVRFFVEFNQIVSRLGDEYGESALLCHAYLALPKHVTP